MLKSLWLLLCVWCRRLLRPDYGMLAAGGKKRSSRWPAVRAEHLKKHPACAVTGDTSDVEVHHILPFHDHPELELDPANLITLSNKPVTPHLLFGHLVDFHTSNPFVREDAALWSTKIKHRNALRKAKALLQLLKPPAVEGTSPKPTPPRAKAAKGRP